MVKVGREAHAVRALLLQVVRKLDAHPLSAHDGDVHVLVERLRGTVAPGVAHAQVHRFRRVETHVDARAEYHMVYEVVFVEAAADKQRPLPGLPLVLQVGPHDMHRLVGVDVVADRTVTQVVVTVLRSERQLRGHEQQLPELVDILHPRRHGQVVRRPVGIGILLAAVVALARRILERDIGVETVAAVGRRDVERKAAPVDRMVDLLGDLRLVGRPVEHVAPAAEFVDMVVLRRDARIGARTEERTHAHRLAVDDGHFGEAVAVVVVARTVAALAEDAKPRPAALGDERSIEHRIVVIGIAAADRSERMRHLRRIARRLLRNDVDRAADGRRPEQRRTAAAQHFDTLDHVGRDLLQAVYARQGREYRVRIDQDLRIMAVETVDAHLREAAVLAVVLDTHAGLERQPLCQARGIGLLEQPGVQHAHQRRRLPAQPGGTAGRYDHLVHRNAALHHLEIQFGRLPAPECHLLRLRGITQRADFERQRALGQVFQEIMPRSVGRGTECRARHGDGRIGNMFMRVAVDHMAEDIGVGTFLRRLDTKYQYTPAHDECQQNIFFHCLSDNK